jgi:hypothetical protein
MMAAQEPSRGRTEQRHFAIFSFLFAMAVLFHQARLSDWEVVSVHAVLTLAALGLALKPASVLRFAALATALIVDWAVHMPVVVNHLWAVAVFCVGLVVAAGAALLRGRSWPRDGGELYARFGPVLRNIVVLVYLFAALAKMNSGFLDSGVSCAVAMSDDLLGRFPVDLRASWQHAPTIWGTIAIELAIPVLLFFKRTRLIGLGIGIPFHIVLALSGHTPFSGFAMAFYSLFLPLDFPDRLDRLRARFHALDALAARAAAAARSPLAFPALAVGWLMCALFVVDLAGGAFDQAVTAVFTVFAVMLGALTAAALLDGRPVIPRERAFRLTHPAWAVVLLVVVANALSPYVGLKTQVSFTMYSNLQTEADQWNHELIPEAVRVFDLQDDVVRVTASSDERLSAAAEDGTRFVWHDFHRHLRKHPDASVTYERAGRRFVVARAGDDPVLSRGESLAERKLLEFRDVPVAEKNECRSRRSAAADQGS